MTFVGFPLVGRDEVGFVYCGKPVWLRVIHLVLMTDLACRE